MKVNLKLLLAFLITSNAGPNSMGQGLFGSFNQGSKNSMPNFMGGINNQASTSSPWNNIFRNMGFGTSSKNNGLIGGTGSSVTPVYPTVSQQSNLEARLSQLETEFRHKTEEIKTQNSRNSKAQDEKIEEIKTQLNRNSKAQDDKIDQIQMKTSQSSQTQDEKMEEIKTQLSKSTKDQNDKIEEIKTQTGRSSKDQDEKIVIIRVRERNLAQLLNQTREDMTVLKTQNRDQSNKIEELERKLAMQSTQSAPSALMKTDNRKEFTGMPTNCNELNQIGHSLNGFYSVRGQGFDKRKNKIETIFCNFKKNEASSSVQETRVGYVDVKHSEGVLFILTGRKILNTSISFRVPILFDKEEINIGRGMNISTTVFTAPRSGLYEFRYSEVFVPSKKAGLLESPTISLRVNKRPKTLTLIQPPVQSSPSFGDGGLLVNFESLQMLKSGDQVELALFIYSGENMGPSYQSVWTRYASYSGRLVEEDLIF